MDGSRRRIGTALRLLLFLAVPLAVWPLLSWLHSVRPPEDALRLVHARFVAGSAWPDHASAGATRALPDDWRRRDSHERDGWYELRFSLAAVPRESWGIYIPALSMNAAGYLNGHFVGDGGRLVDPVSRNWARPLLFPVSPELMAEGDNTVHLHVVSDVARWGLLGPVYVGRLEQLASAHSRRHAFKITAVWVITLCQALVGLFTAALWLQWREEPSYGWFTAATFVWAAMNLSVLVVDPPLPSAAWHALFYLVLGIWAALETRFVYVFLGDRHPGLQRGVLALGAAGAVTVAVLGIAGSALLVPVAHVWITLFLVMGLLSMVETFRELRIHGDDLTVAVPNVLGLSVVPCALHDWMVLLGLLGGELDFFLPYAAAPALVGMGWALLRRFILALRTSELAVTVLEERIRSKRDELELAHLRLREVERSRVLADERQRIMSEMHDGLGSHLVSTLALLESKAAAASIADALRAALEDLRVMIDSLAPVDGDLVAALAMLRARLQPRLEAGGIRVLWRVEDLPPMPGLGPHAVMHVLRILQEAVTNVLKHSGARSIVIRSGSVAGRAGARRVFVEIADDGGGPPPHGDEAVDGFVRRGRGIQSMRKRASAIGGDIELERSEAGTTVRLWMPLAPGAQP